MNKEEEVKEDPQRKILFELDKNRKIVKSIGEKQGIRSKATE